jgi:hypothetical protein
MDKLKRSSKAARIISNDAYTIYGGSFIYYFFGFIEDGEGTSNPVFRSILVKWHLV